MPDRKLALSQILEDLCAFPDDHPIRLGEVTAMLGRRSFGALLFLFGLINALPLPPGSTFVTGVPLVLIAPQLMIGVRALWLPQQLRDHEFKSRDLRRSLGRVIPQVKKFERISRARWSFLFGPVGDRIIGFVTAVLALIIFLPIPFMNMWPALTVAVLAFALFQRDGKALALGYLMTAVNVVILILASSAVIIVLQNLMGFLGLQT